MLKRTGPKTEPCGTPCSNADQVLVKVSFILVATNQIDS